MTTIKGDGIIIASGSSGSSTTQEFALPELQLNNFTVSEGVATFTLGIDTSKLNTAFCLYVTTSTASYLFSAIQSSGMATNNNLPYTAMISSSSGLTFSTDSLVWNTTTYQYTWSLADPGNTDTDLTSGNFTVKAYSLVL